MDVGKRIIPKVIMDMVVMAEDLLGEMELTIMATMEAEEHKQEKLLERVLIILLKQQVVEVFLVEQQVVLAEEALAILETLY